MMTTGIRIFVSYRRQDSQHQTDRLCDYLVARFGEEQVVRDVDLPLGPDDRAALTRKVAGCDVFLAVIGDTWLSLSGPKGTRRIDDPGDFVRIEIEAALGRNIPVVSVLVGNAPVPQAEELPESLRELAYRQGIRVRPNPDFRQDARRLIRGIEELVSALRSGSDARAQQRAEPTEPVEPPKLVTNSLGMTLVLIPAGEFLMGSPESDKDASDDEKPQHRVRITRPFYLGATEVTVGQLRKMVEATGFRTEAETDGKGGYGWNEAKGTFERAPKYTWRKPGLEQTDDHPVVNVSWNDAIAFCNQLSLKEGLTPFYRISDENVVPDWAATGYRLPTEAEWEYACRAGTITRYESGDDPETLALVGNIADGTAKAKYPGWNTIAARDGYVHTAPVGRFRPNAFGLYDMHGNVWEWCWDGYAADYYKRSPDADPLGASQATSRVIRGGSWVNEPRNCRAANRFKFAPGDRGDVLGFRLARVQSR